MKDIQSQKDSRNIYLHQVGIRGLKYPVLIRDHEGEMVPVTGEVDLFVDLEGEQKGTHMSRFVEVLNRYHRMDLHDIRHLLEDIREELEAENSFCKVDFDYYIDRKSVV